MGSGRSTTSSTAAPGVAAVVFIDQERILPPLAGIAIGKPELAAWTSVTGPVHEPPDSAGCVVEPIVTVSALATPVSTSEQTTASAVAQMNPLNTGPP